MRLEDLKDPRDRAAMDRAQHFPTIHEIRKEETVHRQVHVKTKPIAGYDDLIETEFQTGAPRGQRATLPKNFDDRTPGVGGLRFGKKK
jgi:hypothetical protein